MTNNALKLRQNCNVPQESDKKDRTLVNGQILNKTSLLKVSKKCSKAAKKDKVADSPLMFLGITLSKALKVLLPLVRELVLSQVRRRGSADRGVGVRQRVGGLRLPGVRV